MPVEIRKGFMLPSLSPFIAWKEINKKKEEEEKCTGGENENKYRITERRGILEKESEIDRKKSVSESGSEKERKRDILYYELIR